MSSFIETVREHQAVVDNLVSLQNVIYDAAKMMALALSNNNKILFCGNGGSASDSQHLSAELVGRFSKSRRALNSLALTGDGAALTCISNDFGFDHVFERQVRGLASRGDVLVAISTSGNSVNVSLAIDAAKELGVSSIFLTGERWTKACENSDLVINIPSVNTARIQECHIMVGHYLCEAVEELLEL